MKLEIIDYGMNGEGVAKLDGKIVLVENALIGEQVEADILADHKTYANAIAKNILKPSPHRTSATCPHGECGGCALMHMDYEEQLKFKQLLVYKTLKKVAGIDAKVEPCVASDKQFNYRNKLNLHLCEQKIGFYKTGSKNIVEINNCALASGNINKVAKIFSEFLNKTNISSIKNLVVRELNNQILVGVVSREELDLTKFYLSLASAFKKVGLFNIINTRKDSVALSGKVKHIAGLTQIEQTNFGIKYAVDLIGFHQTNEDVQNKIYTYITKHIKADDIAVNGFSGAGLLSAILASKAKKVVGIEIEKSSHLSAEKLKKCNKIDNLTNILGDFLQEYKKIAPKVKPSTVVLDPAKKGCGQKVMSTICGLDNIIYVSCNPIALAKDLRVIKENYIIEEITPFDMFPNTNSVETVVILKRRKTL